MSTSFYSATVKFGRGNVSLGTLEEGWASRVLKLRSDAAASVRSGQEWGLDDLVGCYYIRQAIENGLASDPDLEAPSSLEAIDALLLTFTSRENIATLRKQDPMIPDTWWWERIPINGPIREQFDQLTHN